MSRKQYKYIFLSTFSTSYHRNKIATVCPRSLLVHFYIANHYIGKDKTSWLYSTSMYCIVLTENTTDMVKNYKIFG